MFSKVTSFNQEIGDWDVSNSDNMDKMTIKERKPESIYYGAIGGFTASLLTHPFDSLKTWYMSGNKSFPIKWTFENYMRGWYYRSGVSLISMNIGWIIYYRLSK